MEPASRYLLDSLSTLTWKDEFGLPLQKRIEEAVERLAGIDAIFDQGLVISVDQPDLFCSTFMAAVHLGAPVILANPKWGKLERKEFQKLATPVLEVSSEGMVLQSNTSGRIPLSKGSIYVPTGGSTGGVKLAEHTWESLSTAALGLQNFLGGGSIDSVCCLPLFHVSGLMQVVRSFVTQGRIYFVRPRNSFETILQSFDSEGFCISLVPTQLRRVLKNESTVEKLRHMRAVFLGGASLPEDLADEARAQRIPIVHGYGMTETAAMVAAIPSSDFLSGKQQGGQLLPHVEMRLFDEWGKECSVGTKGRIRIRSAALFKGFLGKSAIDQKLGYLTGDEGCFDAMNRLHLIGRVDDMIITGGEKVDPREVETVLLEKEGLEEALVIGYDDREWGQIVVAFVTVRSEIENSELVQLIKSKLAPYKVPKHLFQVDTLPLNDRGKPDRDLIMHFFEH